MNFAANRRDGGIDGTITVAFSGELDMASADRAQQALSEAEAAQPRTIVLDLSELTFMDSTGLNLIIRADGRARDSGWKLSIVPGPESVHRLFQITLLDERLEFVTNSTEPSPEPAPSEAGRPKDDDDPTA